MNTPKRLYRSRSDRMFGGVCGGLADYLNLDPSIVRIAAALLILSTGGGGMLYLLLWILLPSEPDAIDMDELFEEKPKRG